MAGAAPGHIFMYADNMCIYTDMTGDMPPRYARFMSVCQDLHKRMTIPEYAYGVPLCPDHIHITRIV